MKNKELQEMFDKLDKNPATDWKAIAWNIAIDFRKERNKNKELEDENKNLKEQLKEAKSYFKTDFNF